MAMLDDAYYEACYTAWRRGQDPDAVDPYEVREEMDHALDKFDAADAVVDRMVRRREREDPDA